MTEANLPTYATAEDFGMTNINIILEFTDEELAAGKKFWECAENNEPFYWDFACLLKNPVSPK